MSRPLRLQFHGACYHVRARGNARQVVFVDDDDRGLFLSRLSAVAIRLEWEILAYCLMLNHYHLLVWTSRPTLAQGMRDLNGSYAQRFNRRHDRIGHLFEGRYRSSLVDSDAYVLELARYIALNPVRAGLCRVPEAWPWSSYRTSLGLSQRWPGLDDHRVLDYFDGSLAASRDAFARFVLAKLSEPDADSPWSLPSPERGGAVGSGVAAGTPAASLEVPRRERRMRTLAEFARLAGGDRNDAIRQAYASGTFSLREIGAYFGLHYSTVSHIVRRDGRGHAPEAP